jgi:hypothetical protein
VEWSLDGPLPKLCPLIPTSNQDGRQAKNRKRGNEILIVEDFFLISSPLFSNLHNRSKSAKFQSS